MHKFNCVGISMHKINMYLSKQIVDADRIEFTKSRIPGDVNVLFYKDENISAWSFTMIFFLWKHILGLKNMSCQNRL